MSCHLQKCDYSGNNLILKVKSTEFQATGINPKILDFMNQKGTYDSKSV